MKNTRSKTTNIPGEIVIADQEFSLRKAWMVNAWLFVAALTSALSDVIYSQALRQWPVGLRLGILLFEYAAVLLWVRRLARWIRGMDEMHRQVTLATLLFSVSATLIFTLLWLRLEVGGFFEALIGAHTGFGMGTLSFAILGHSIFYGIGHYLIFNRRFK
jgi:hypothetical protein